jgi:hypothetical protein
MFLSLRRNVSIKSARAEGAYAGGNNTSGEDFLDQVGHATEQTVNRIEHDASEHIHGLEASKNHSEDQLGASNARLTEILAEGRPKPLLYGLIMLLMFFAAMSSEVYLLMPTMRGFGIAEPLHQMLAAAGIVLMGAIVLKFLYTEARHYFGMTPEERAKASTWKLQRILLPLVAATVLTGFLFLGMFRASEMIFANSLDAFSDLGRFVSEHDALTKAVLIFLTVMLPVAGALALSHGIEIVRNWFEWTRLRYLTWLHSRRVHQTTKSLEAAREKLDKRVAEARGYGDEVKSEYRDGYNHGQRAGLHRLPTWFYILKTVAVGLGMTFVMFVMDLWLESHFQLPGWRWIFYAAGILFVTGLYGMRQWRIRERPKPEEVIWKPIWRDEDSPQVVVSQQIPLPLNGGQSAGAFKREPVEYANAKG